MVTIGRLSSGLHEVNAVSTSITLIEAEGYGSIARQEHRGHTYARTLQRSLAVRICIGIGGTSPSARCGPIGVKCPDCRHRESHLMAPMTWNPLPIKALTRHASWGWTEPWYWTTLVSGVVECSVGSM